MKRCAVCRERFDKDAMWAWQPVGLDGPRSVFTVPGWHYRGYPAITVCDSCMERIKRGEDVRFRYKGRIFILRGEDISIEGEEVSA